MEKKTAKTETIQIPARKDKTTSRLVLVVEYEGSMDDSEIEETVDSARQYGHVVMARFCRLAPTTTDFV